MLVTRRNCPFNGYRKYRRLKSSQGPSVSPEKMQASRSYDYVWFSGQLDALLHQDGLGLGTLFIY